MTKFKSSLLRPAAMVVLSASCALPAFAQTAPKPLQKWMIKDYLRHQWNDEIVQFPISYSGSAPKNLTLADAAGKPVPTQITGLASKNGKVTGSAWTVLSLAPQEVKNFQLQTGAPAPTALRLQDKGTEYLLGNERITLRLPKFSGILKQPVSLTSLPAPLIAIGDADAKEWLGQGAWTSADGEPPLMVKAATTTVVEQGPIRTKISYRLTFTDNRFYNADILLGAGQDAATFYDVTDIDAAKTAFRFSFQPGLGADRLFWRNNYYAKELKGLKPEPINFEKEQVITSLCPWSFWWQEDRTTYAGFYKETREPFVGVIALRPSQWSPTGWDGFTRTMIPVTARPGGQLDITLALLAQSPKEPENKTVTPARRLLAFTVGKASEHVIDDPRKVKLRGQLIKYSEFPLNEVKDFGFDFTRKSAKRKHPFLFFTPEDIERSRRQAKTVPELKADLDRATQYISRIGVDPVKKINGPDGWNKFFEENYVGNGLYDVAPRAYVGSDDPKYGLILAAGVKGLARQHIELFLNNPYPPTMAGAKHMSGTTMLRLLLAYDALADTEYLSKEDKEYVESALVFGGYVFDHPDYWNSDVGLVSANPNMTSLLKLPLGLVALFLDGHPRSAHWMKFAEAELQEELNHWIMPDGAFIECPFYQAPTLDGMFLLAQAIKNVKGKDYFSDPKFKATMDYYGFILTAPDFRYPYTQKEGITAPMTIPSVGDAFPVFTHPFNGWMAKTMAKSDPEYSARQQFYWKAQSYATINGGRAGFIPPLVDADLPAAPPRELARRFEGFGNIMRTSWTDPKQSYISHRNGYFHHHFDPGDANSIIYHAKGVPLVVDFGHRGATSDQVLTMWKPTYHTSVSFDRDNAEGYWGSSGGPAEANKQAQEVRSLPATIDYSTGVTLGAGGQTNHRHLLLVKSADQMGATYLVMRDITTDGQPNQKFKWNLWVMAKEPEINGNVAHFPGQAGVDLDAHVLLPANPQFTKDQYSYRQWVNPWGFFDEAQTGVHVPKAGSKEDFFAVLFPRAAGQAAATITSLADGRAARVNHMEGSDLVLLSPAKPAEVKDGECSLKGEIAFARRYPDGSMRLAVVKGESTATYGDWSLSSNGAVSLEIKGNRITGESSGQAHEARITLPAGLGPARVLVNGKAIPSTRAGQVLTVQLPAGDHLFAIQEGAG